MGFATCHECFVPYKTHSLSSSKGFFIIFQFYFFNDPIQKERSFPTYATQNEVIFSGLPKNHRGKFLFNEMPSVLSITTEIKIFWHPSTEIVQESNT